MSDSEKDHKVKKKKRFKSRHSRDHNHIVCLSPTLVKNNNIANEISEPNKEFATVHHGSSPRRQPRVQEHVQEHLQLQPKLPLRHYSPDNVQQYSSQLNSTL